MKKMKNTKKGFTLIELLVVIAIIGILAAVTLSSLNTARAKARDATRINDLRQIGLAVQMYAIDYGDTTLSACNGGTGVGYQGEGVGWFNYGPSSQYTYSAAQCLIDFGYVGEEIIDPSNSRTGSYFGNDIHVYMYDFRGASVSGYPACVMAKLEVKEQDAVVMDGVCNAGWDSHHGMNYAISID